MSHPHIEKIIEWARLFPNVERRFRIPGKQDWSSWCLNSQSPAWLPAWEYEVRPLQKPLYQRRVKIPRPLTEAPEDGTEVWLADPVVDTMLDRFAYFAESVSHEMWLKRGLLYATEAEAVARAEAMLATKEGDHE